MLAWAAAAIGAVIGVIQARRKGGKALDMLQFGAVYGIIFGLIAVVLMIVLVRMGYR